MDFKRNYLANNPLCVGCLASGRPVRAVEVDHKVALANGGKDFDQDPGQAQGLCLDCHKTKTAIDMGYRSRATIGLDGWPE